MVCAEDRLTLCPLTSVGWSSRERLEIAEESDDL